MRDRDDLADYTRRGRQDGWFVRDDTSAVSSAYHPSRENAAARRRRRVRKERRRAAAVASSVSFFCAARSPSASRPRVPRSSSMPRCEFFAKVEKEESSRRWKVSSAALRYVRRLITRLTDSEPASRSTWSFTPATS